MIYDSENLCRVHLAFFFFFWLGVCFFFPFFFFRQGSITDIKKFLYPPLFYWIAFHATLIYSLKQLMIMQSRVNSLHPLTVR